MQCINIFDIIPVIILENTSMEDATMTKKERVIAVIEGREADAVPSSFSLHFPLMCFLILLLVLYQIY